MSLFEGLFQQSCDRKDSGLFSAANKFRTSAAAKQPPQSVEEQQQPQLETKKKRKKEKAGHDDGLQRLEAGMADAAATAAAVEAMSTVAAAVSAKQKRKLKEPASAAPDEDRQDKKRQEKEKQQQQQQQQQQQSDEREEAAPSKKRKSKKQQVTEQQAAAAAAAAATAAQVAAKAPGGSDAPESSSGEEEPDTVAAAAQQQPPQQPGAAAAAAVPRDPAAEAAKLRRTVFVGNLPVSMKRKAVARLFAAYGEVDSVRLRSVPLDLDSQKKMPRKAAVIKGVVSGDRGGANAFVVFKEPAAASAALAANMTLVEGHHIRVDRAAAPAAAEGAAAGAAVMYDPARSVFVGGLDWKVSQDEVITAFSDGSVAPELSGAVEAVRLVRDAKTNLGKGIAFVLFTTKAAAHAALQLNGTKLGKRTMRVTRVDRKASAAAAAAAAGPARGGGAKGGGALGRINRTAAGSLGVRGGGVQKRPGQQRLQHPGRGGGVAEDWQGLRTKGKGGFRATPAAGSGGGSRADSRPAGRAGGGGGAGPAGAKKGGKPGKQKGGKRPAVVARKAAQQAAAKKKAPKKQ